VLKGWNDIQEILLARCSDVDEEDCPGLLDQGTFRVFLYSLREVSVLLDASCVYSGTGYKSIASSEWVLCIGGGKWIPHIFALMGMGRLVSSAWGIYYF